MNKERITKSLTEALRQVDTIFWEVASAEMDKDKTLGLIGKLSHTLEGIALNMYESESKSANASRET